MKLLPILPAVLFAVAASFSFGAHAEDTAAAPAAASVPAKKAMKPHSHVEEKNGVVTKAKAADAASADKAGTTADAKKDAGDAPKKKKNTNHSHPRDAK